MRLLMLISAATTVLGIAVVITVIGYRLFHADGRLGAADARPDAADQRFGSANGRLGAGLGAADGRSGAVDQRLGPSETTALLPKGARIIQTAVAGQHIVVTVDIGGKLEIRTFDASTLRPEGRLRFDEEP